MLNGVALRHVLSKDTNRNNALMYTEFIAGLLEIRERIDVAKLEDAFEQLDVDSSGYINAKDLKMMLGRIGTNEYVRSLLDEVDSDKDGQISLKEFKEYMMEKNDHHIQSSLVP